MSQQAAQELAAEYARDGAPGAMQAADRWHLCRYLHHRLADGERKRHRVE